MKKFILKVFLFIVVSFSLILFVIGQANGYTDAYYMRFTTPSQENLIIGTSRAAHSLQPDVFKDNMNLNIYNYAFTNAHSPYGPVYLKSIKKKLKSNTKKGVFIITVDPWSISSNISEPNAYDDFRENKRCVGTTSRVNVKPNYQYLFKNLSGAYYKILLNSIGGKFHRLFRLHKPLYLHENGWLEVTTKMDSISVKKRTENRINIFRESGVKESKYSSLRFEYLIKTVLFLKKHGSVYIVRLPIHKEVTEIENEFMPDFNEKMIQIGKLSEGYFDMTQISEKFVYIDGHHIYKDSGRKVTEEIINWIEIKQSDKSF